MVGQSLTALKLDVTSLVRHLPFSPETAKRADEILALIDSSTEQVRIISAELSPPLLDVGLAEAIDWYAREFERRSGISCLTMLDETCCDLLPKEEETMLFRVLQEAMTNVLRHAGASEVSISLCARPAAVVLEIADNGKGITDQAASSPTAFGLLGMRERATMCGATFSITGAPGRGTIVKLELLRNGRKGVTT